MKGQIEFMKGISESRAFFEEKGLSMIRKDFSEYENRIAAGLVGQGSECFGFDDEISRDHDFAPRFCLWISREDASKIGLHLSSAYQNLIEKESANIAARSGVFVIEDFYMGLIGCSGVPQNWKEWFSIPEYALATAVNGEVFQDDLGKFSEIRKTLQNGYPQDVLLKKLAAHLALMAQSGQYNHRRALKRGDYGAAHLAINEYINHSFHCLFLLNNAYLPFYKWRFRAAKALPFLSDIPALMLNLLQEQRGEMQMHIIEQISARFLSELNRRELSSEKEIFLEASAIDLMKKIKDPSIRNLHLMEYGAD